MDEPQEDATENTADEEMEEGPVIPLVTNVNHFLHSIFFNCWSVQYYSANLQLKSIWCA